MTNYINKNLLLIFISSIFFLNNLANAKTIKNQNLVSEFIKDLSIFGQITAIHQTSNLKLKSGDLKDSSGNNISDKDLSTFSHKNYSGSFSGDLIIEKKFNKTDFFQLDLQFATGQGTDANLQGGSMINNDIMEDANNHHRFYIAKAFLEKKFKLNDQYDLTFDLGKFGVNDFFDVGEENSDQTTQFLNQAISNNGAFDYVQDLRGRGYTYGFRSAISNDFAAFDLGLFSSDSYLDNISHKYSIIGAITLKPNFGDNLPGIYQFYVFSNKGEYGAFDDNGNFITKNTDYDSDGVGDNINSADNSDNLNKNGFGISITQSLSDKINIFAKYGKQDDDRDVRHYQDQDESYMIGANFNGKFWSRANDEIGIAYQVARLTGNHRKAHEKGYGSFFNRYDSAIGAGNYDDESVLEAYYRYSLNKNISISLDAQHISNFYYSKLIGNVEFFALRFNSTF